MKSERRHELQQNVLANRMADWIEAVKPYASWIVGGVIVGLLVAMIIVFQRGESEADRAANWDAYYAAAGTQDAEKLKSLALQQAGHPLGEITSLTLADTYMTQATQQARTNRPEANKKFEMAAANYKTVADSTKDPLMKNRGRFGQGQAYEWMMQLDKATAAYEQVQGPLQLQAKQRLADLKNPSTAKFYEQFASYTPRPAVDPASLSPNFDYAPEGEGGSDFDLLGPLDPNKQDDKLPPIEGLPGVDGLPDLNDTGEGETPAAGETTEGEEETTDEPAPPGTPPAEEAPGEEPPAEETAPLEESELKAIEDPAETAEESPTDEPDAE